MVQKIVCLLILSFATVASAEDPVNLPLRRIALFNSGLGFFEHQEQVDGNAVIEMKFDKRDINDLLKSLVVQDLDGGRIKTVSYPSRLPISEQLAGLSIDLSTQPTLGELIHQLRGEEINLDDGRIIGTIIGVELKPHNFGQQVMNREVLNLLTDKGLRGIALDSVAAIQLVNEKLNAELREALKLLVAQRRVDKIAVRFEFVGIGKRTVRIGYIRETPIWKTSYRVVLDKDEPTLLQGWAMVENTSEADWNKVQLTLTNGRLVTFQMDLYRPLLVRRQTLLPSVPASLASRTYSPALGRLDIHEHVELLRSALGELKREHVDQIVMLGDVFKMGERMQETCELLRDSQVIGVWGNHDLGFCDDPSPAICEEYGDLVIEYMSTLQPRLEIDGCRFQHVEPWLNPNEILDLWYFEGTPDTPEKVARIFQAIPHRLAFAGHFHRWLLVTPDGVTEWSGENAVQLAAPGQYSVVIGALCDGSYAIFDTKTCELVPREIR